MNAQSVTRALQRTCLRQSLSHASHQHVRQLSSRTLSPLPSLLRPSTALSRRPQFHQQRYESSANPLTDRPDQAPATTPREEQPAYEMTFTCKACSTRSSHRMSKQGYHHGTILITCPGCKNRHLIADHLKIFSDKAITLEDILKEKGQLLKKGALDTESDMEFWDDGTQTERSTTPTKSD